MNNNNNQENQNTIIRLNSIDSFKIINPNVEQEHTNSSMGFSGSGTGAGSENVNEQNLLIVDNTSLINTTMEPEQAYLLLLDEIYEIISDNKELFENKNINISKPEIKYENRKTFWYNYGKNCEQINRDTKQLKKFIDKELAVESSINDKSQLILRGRYDFAVIAKQYKKYIKEYVQCSSCGKFDTEIIRINRLDYLKCLKPGCNTCKVVKV